MSTRHPLAPLAKADSTYDERAASNAAGEPHEPDSTHIRKPQAITITAIDAPNGNVSESTQSNTVGTEINASTTTTEELASAALRATMAAMSSSPCHRCHYGQQHDHKIGM